MRLTYQSRCAPNLFQWRYYRIVVLCMLTMVSHAAIAEALDGRRLSEASLEELLLIKVNVASNVESDWLRQPSSLSIISQEQIRRVGARTVNELLSLLVPGYFMVEDQDDTIAGFRGVAPDNNSKVMLLLNGENLNTEWFWGPPDAILNGMDLDYIERVEVIRGPGSVTLGQGALLGVINIVTRPESESGQWNARTHVGEGGLATLSVRASLHTDQMNASLYLGHGDYQGQSIPNVGWASGRAEQGLSVYERQHHLRGSAYDNALISIATGGSQWDIYRFDQTRDLYNFYRDRESVQQILTGANYRYKHELDEHKNLQVYLSFQQDDYALFSHGGNLPSDSRLAFEQNGSVFSPISNSYPGLSNRRVSSGLTMGGTRETRWRAKALLNWDDLLPDNKLAIGVEVTHVHSGQTNERGHNYILNEEIQLLGIQADGQGNLLLGNELNAANTWVKSQQLRVESVFVEDVYSLSTQWDFFSAFRYDNHPNWGRQITPRLGLLFERNERQFWRLSWQTGFRGAVGVQYSGGFVQDGLLAEQNFALVNQLATSHVDFDFDGIAANDSKTLSPLKPEEIRTVEFAGVYLGDTWHLNGVLFFNTITDILKAEAHGYEGMAYGDMVGSDTIATWNGHWYYQNQADSLKQLGAELEASYQWRSWKLSLSHAHVSTIQSSTSAYTLNNGKSIAFPSDITRAQLFHQWLSSVGLIKLNYHHLLYSSFYAPNGEYVNGTSLGNAYLAWEPNNPWSHWTMSININNIWDTDALYPINSTGNAIGSAGSPTIEARNFWLSVNYQF